MDYVKEIPCFSIRAFFHSISDVQLKQSINLSAEKLNFELIIFLSNSPDLLRIDLKTSFLDQHFFSNSFSCFEKDVPLFDAQMMDFMKDCDI